MLSNARWDTGRRLPTTPTLRILVVDDDPDDVALVCHALASCGRPGDIQVSVAATGAEALRSLRNAHRQPDLVLLDLDMPRMDGRTFLTTIAARREVTPPVVVWTSSPAPDDLAHVRAAGADGYVRKPFGMRALRDTVRELLDVWSR